MDYKDKVIALLNSQELSKEQKEKLEEIFPELAESEDEKIRKRLMEWVEEFRKLNPTNADHNAECSEALAWVEKQGKITKEWSEMKINRIQTELQEMVDLKQKTEQGEQKPAYTKEYDFHGIKFIPKFAKGDIIKDKKCGEVSTIEDFSYDTGLYTHTYGQFPITIQDNYEIIAQKPADKVEPKFHEGDWVVNKGHSYLIADIDFLDNRYLFEIGGYTHEQLNWEYIENVDNKYHLWTIQDAKAGDVLASDTWTFIFKKYQDKSVYYHCAVSTFNNFSISDTGEFDSNYVHPATKEQRNLLFQKMKEAGYEWDAEKKELKKIEQKPAWSEEDERRRKRIVERLEDIRKSKEDNIDVASIILSEINWLKSLRPQSTWKPSDEQMDALEAAIVDSISSIQKHSLESLFKELKKL